MYCSHQPFLTMCRGRSTGIWVWTWIDEDWWTDEGEVICNDRRTELMPITKTAIIYQAESIRELSDHNLCNLMCVCMRSKWFHALFYVLFHFGFELLFCWLVIQFQYRKPSSAGSQIFSPGPIRSMLFGVGPESLSYDINGLEINQTNNNKKSYSTMWSRILSALNHSDALSWRSRVIRMSFFFRFVLFVWCMQLIMATTTTTTSTIHLNVHQPEFHRDKKNIAFGHGGIGGPQKKTYQNDWRDICGPGHRARILCKYITTRHNSTASSNN